MAQAISPAYTRNRVNTAGRRARRREAGLEDRFVIDNWRASHAHILNAFQTTLRNKRTGNEQIVQRLKRLPTIIDKLQRRPNFSLTEMQDIAGCRVICENTPELREFRSNFLKSRISHRRIGAQDRYDYIMHPKDDGYRGVHDVFEYKSRKVAGLPWQGLRLEIQYRTTVQHAWATAVEVAGFLTENDPKFGRGSAEYMDFFRCCSEILARRQEGMTGPLPRSEFSQLERTVAEIEERTEILAVFRRFNRLEDQFVPQFGNRVYLIIRPLKQEGKNVELKPFESFSDALRTLGDFEKRHYGDEDYDVVVIRNVAGGFVNTAYRNYFTDTKEFVSMIENSVPAVKQ